MSRDNFLVAIVISIFAGFGLLLYFVSNHQNHGGPGSAAAMPYRDQSIRLSKDYSDYDTYQNDPNNIAAEEIPRVQGLVKAAPILRNPLTAQQMNHEMFEIKFPGYGLMSMPCKQDDGTVLQVYSIEIPQADQERVIVFRQTGNSFLLIDDFVLDNELVKDVKEESGDLVYQNPEGKIIAKHKPLQ